MLKEIHEQPDALRETIGERLEGGERRARHGPHRRRAAAGVERVTITACGTACHAGMVGRLPDRAVGQLPSTSSTPPSSATATRSLDERTLAIAVSQSGETADTIAAQRVAREGGALTLAICNQMGIAAHARGRRHALHPQRPRDLRRGDEDVHVAGASRSRCSRCTSPSCAGTLEPERIAELRGGHRRAARARRRLPGRGLARLGRRPSASPRRSGRRSSSSTSAATSACRSASRARSS